jgi:hypothetical protein
MNPIRHVRAFNREAPVFPKEAVDQRIEAILNNFPFDRVGTAMAALKWSWGEDSGPPTETTMRSTARRLLRRIAETPPSQAVDLAISSGGFRVRKSDNGELALEFVLAHQDETLSEEDDEDKPAAPGFFVCPFSSQGPRKAHTK